MEDRILILTTEKPTIVRSEGSKSLESVRGGNVSEDYIEKHKLTKEIAKLSEAIQSAVSAIDSADSLFELGEITVNAEISASGKIGLLGFGANAGMKSGLSFKFVRKSDKKINP